MALPTKIILELDVSPSNNSVGKILITHPLLLGSLALDVSNEKLAELCLATMDISGRDSANPIISIFNSAGRLTEGFEALRETIRK